MIKLVILRGKLSKNYFGVQVVGRRFVIQYAFRKFGIYDRKNSRWLNEKKIPMYGKGDGKY